MPEIRRILLRVIASRLKTGVAICPSQDWETVPYYVESTRFVIPSSRKAASGNLSLAGMVRVPFHEKVSRVDKHRLPA